AEGRGWALVKGEIARLARIIQAARARKATDQRDRRAALRRWHQQIPQRASGKGPRDRTQHRRVLARSSPPQTNIRLMDPARFGPAACSNCARIVGWTCRAPIDWSP